MSEATSVPSAPDRPPRKLYRSGEGRLLGGVARGLAGHLGLPVFWVRAAFIGLLLVNGLGTLLYAAFWFFVPLGVGGVDEPGDSGTRGRVPWRARVAKSTARDRGQLVALLLMLVVALTYAARTDIGETARGYLVPGLLVGAGVALVWRQADNARRARWVEIGRRRRTLNVLRAAAGVVLVGTGVSVIIVLQGSAQHLGSAFQAALAVLVGLVLLVGPYLIRMTQDLSEERLMRIRAQERAEVAAHVHDSVLHTLTLIQRHAERPQEVRRLARAQERELREWLRRPEGSGRNEQEEPTRLADAVRKAAAEVEDKHGVPLEVVIVGDSELDDALSAMMQAAREAMVNAAKYGGGGEVQVYAEVEAGQVFVSVRDHGPGFDPEAVPADRMGVRESVVGRMRRNGGRARIRPAPGGGTVVELEMERLRDE
ncbi:ATP-binding protein [Streptomyces evansiae]|uniref:ATP-binding protein n=1 Tax=Streptomyces evansiae TaxID=3075535 RepID=UPI002887F056|nr:PspC domain-containing protein [Streptomyces sp. DSM 41859]MDT0425224.1 PspC domain-containing protein [Streptomyces sp. DSM 41859]